MLEKRSFDDENSPFFTTPDSLTDFILRVGKTVFREGVLIADSVKSSVREVIGIESGRNNSSSGKNRRE
ncbi:hypothetical protein GF366_05095 [Candidatus Peregrinibacteria bacterium]|nr:hypothetical protein [Candidatus Peregrinibacteria bacterium]